MMKAEPLKDKKQLIDRVCIDYGYCFLEGDVASAVKYFKKKISKYGDVKSVEEILKLIDEVFEDVIEK